MRAAAAALLLLLAPGPPPAAQTPRAPGPPQAVGGAAPELVEQPRDAPPQAREAPDTPPGADDRSPAAQPGSPQRSPGGDAREGDDSMRGAEVSFDGRLLFTLRTDVAPFSRQERADVVERRIAQVARDPAVSPDQIEVLSADAARRIMAGDRILLTLTQKDADVEGRPLDVAAQDYRDRIRGATISYREERSARKLALGLLVSLLATAGLWVLWRMIRGLAGRLQDRLRDRGRPAGDEAPVTGRAALLAAPTFIEWQCTVVRTVRSVLLLVLAYGYVGLVSGQFPWTRELSRTLLGAVLQPLEAAGRGILAALPDLASVVIVIAITRVILRLIRFFFVRIEAETFRFEGFPAEWAMPTYKVVRAVVVAMAFAAAWPYLPGSGTPAFQGVSVFLGVLVSFGSSSAVGNIVAGVVITYMRPFSLGDRVRVADTEGDVIEKTLLVTRIQTIKNVEITIPNSMILASHIVNFSAMARGPGLILNTSVTIGYDAPWRQVHDLLIAAARRTPMIETQPEPFVLQTSLDDFYVTYELNAFTREPNRKARIYSLLHQNIQDEFNRAGVEIMSPHYRAQRDGSESTVVPREKEGGSRVEI